MTQQPAARSNAKWAGPFFTVWTGQAFSLLGSELVQFALVWYLTASTGSATVLAMAYLAALLPQIFIGPVAGALIDRWSRRIVMIVSDSLIALVTAGLAALFALDLVEVWHIYVLLMARSAGGAFQRPAMQASTTLMVPKEHFARVQGINQTLMGALTIVSPALGALLLNVLPMQGILAIDMSTALVAVLPLLFIAVPQPKASPTQSEATTAPAAWALLIADLRAGLRFVRGFRGLMLLIATSVLTNLLLAPAVSLVPLMVANHFGGGAMQLAWLHVAWGLGMVVGGLALAASGGFKRRMVTGTASAALMGVGLAIIGVTPATAIQLAIGAAFFSAVMNTVSNGSIMAVLQSVVPPEIQGRVFTLMNSLLSATVPLGLVVAGPLSDAVGVQAWFIVGGAVATVTAIVTFFIPEIMHIEEARPEASPPGTRRAEAQKDRASRPGA
jgi:DHA3 family macrolide efflux protein-like MFS transporter